MAHVFKTAILAVLITSFSACGIRARFIWESDFNTNAAATPGFTAASGGGVATGGAYVLHGSAGSPDAQPVVTGGAYRIYPGPIHGVNGY